MFIFLNCIQVARIFFRRNLNEVIYYKASALHLWQSMNLFCNWRLRLKLAQYSNKLGYAPSYKISSLFCYVLNATAFHLSCYDDISFF